MLCVKNGPTGPVAQPPAFSHPVSAFKLSDANSDGCPPTFSILGDIAACESSALIAKTFFGGSLSLASYPGGCYWHRTANSFYFNIASGGANYFAQRVCAGAPATPPTFSPRSEFALGSANDCAASNLLERLKTETACEKSATNANMTYGGSETYSGLPRGCYWITTGSSFYFNPDPVGAQNSYARPVCAALGTSAPTFSCGPGTYKPANTVVCERCMCVCVSV